MSTERSTERRLLLVGNGWGRDGAPLLLLALARGYRDAGYALTTAAPGDGPLRAEFAALGETVSLPDWHGHQPKRSFLAAAARLVALAARERAVAVIANTSQALAGVIAARALRLPCVWCVREGADPATLPFGRWLERACGRDVDLVFEAEAVRRLWAPWLRGPSHVIPNGVPDPGPPQPGDRAAAREALGIPLDAEVVVQVGTVCHRKGQDVLLEALALPREALWESASEPPLAYVVGPGEPLRAQAGVTWVGPVDDPSPWFKAADLVVSSSREESHPRVVLEALAHGRAVVATDVGGVREQIATPLDGLLAEPDDPRTLRSRIALVQAMPMYPADLEPRARARYEAAFREERMLADHTALIDRVLRRPGHAVGVRRLLRGSGGSGRLNRATALVRRLGWREAIRAVRGPMRPRARNQPWPEPKPVVTAPNEVRFGVLRTSPDATLEALIDQPVERWALRESWQAADDDYLVLLRPGDVLLPGALDALAAAIVEDPTRDVVYGDELRVGEDGSVRPVFKPQLCPELLLSAPYLGSPVAVRRALIDPPQDSADAHEITLRATEEARVVYRIPRLLARRPRPDLANRGSVSAALDRRGLHGDVRPHPAVPNALEIRLHPPPGTTVALIVPTRDRADLLGALRRSLRRTTWPHWRLVIVDNGSRDPAALAEIQAAKADGAQVIVRDQPFDHSALCNAGAEAAGDVDVFCFLNDDVEVIAPDWLEDLLALALSPPIGAVGARLVFPDGRLQHGGVVLGIGPDRIAGHAHFGEPAHSTGDLGLTRLLGNASAVTGACLAVRRAAFEQVGGFDLAFPTDYNDVDLCLRLRAAGLRTAWTPRAELLHHGGASRPRAIDPAAIAAFRERWADALVDDPCYHPLRTRARQDFGWNPAG